MITYFMVDNDGLIIERGSRVRVEDLPEGEVYQFEAPLDATHYINGEFSTQQDVNLLRLEALQKRTGLLLASDWTQLPDAPADKEAWSAYRQHLRDITEQPEFPTKIDWGTPPNEV